MSIYRKIRLLFSLLAPIIDKVVSKILECTSRGRCKAFVVQRTAKKGGKKISFRTNRAAAAEHDDDTVMGKTSLRHNNLD